MLDRNYLVLYETFLILGLYLADIDIFLYDQLFEDKHFLVWKLSLPNRWQFILTETQKGILNLSISVDAFWEIFSFLLRKWKSFPWKSNSSQGLILSRVSNPTSNH